MVHIRGERFGKINSRNIFHYMGRKNKIKDGIDTHITLECARTKYISQLGFILCFIINSGKNINNM